MNIKSLLNNKENKNAYWIIAGKVSQMIISFFVSIWSARYLGPSNYGLLSYVAAYVAFFTSFCTLGVTSSVLIRELTYKPDAEGQTIGTVIVLRIISSILSSITVVAIVAIVDKGDKTTVVIALLTSFSLIFQIFDTFEYWFQKRYKSKVTSIAAFVAYCVTALYKMLLLILQKDVVFFALANSVDYLAIALILYIVYKKNKGPKLSFSWKRAKEILSKSCHFILSGMMVVIYGQTDKIMLKQLMSETEVGYYSLAFSRATMWAFILGAVISSISPTIIKYKNEGNEKAYINKNIRLYRIIFYLSLLIASLFTVFASLLIRILYGEAYTGAINPMRIITWYVAFAYMGVARDIWMVCENKQKYLTYIYFIAALCNVALNFLLIPRWGASGAALASVITQMLTCIGLPMLFKAIRPNVKLMLMGIFCLNKRFINQEETENKN